MSVFDAAVQAARAGVPLTIEEEEALRMLSEVDYRKEPAGIYPADPLAPKIKSNPRINQDAVRARLMDSMRDRAFYSPDDVVTGRTFGPSPQMSRGMGDFRRMESEDKIPGAVTPDDVVTGRIFGPVMPPVLPSDENVPVVVEDVIRTAAPVGFGGGTFRNDLARDAVASGDVPVDVARNLYERGGAGGIMEIEGADGTRRFRYLDESADEERARQMARPVTNPEHARTLAAVGLTPSGGRIENRGGIDVEVPMSRAHGSYSTDQVDALIAARLQPLPDPKLQIAREQSDAEIAARNAGVQAQQMNALANIIEAEKKQPELVRAENPATGQTELYSPLDFSQPVAVLGQPRPEKPADLPPLRDYSFGTGNDAEKIPVHPLMAQFFSEVGASSASKFRAALDAYGEGLDEENVEWIADYPDYAAAFARLAQDDPGILEEAAVLAESPGAVRRLNQIRQLVKALGGGKNTASIDLSSIR